jgi:hypothetical protein
MGYTPSLPPAICIECCDNRPNDATNNGSGGDRRNREGQAYRTKKQQGHHDERSHDSRVGQNLTAV